jgi:tRNA(fMet)-specific endonuclease VapC
VTALFLLDTNIVYDLVRRPQGQVALKIAATGEELVATTIIVAAELRYDAFKKGSSRLSAQLNVILGALNVLALEPPVDEVYGSLRAALEKAGRLVRPNDLLIAAQTLALRMTLVTDNEREFRRIDGLRVENWLRS